jgi:acetoin:2,6-dichlorophenolindophenol oxidoreductase subunit alpha
MRNGHNQEVIAPEKIATGSSPAELLESMMLVRAFEQQLPQLGLTMVCTSIGQEASAVGVVRALNEHDLILTNHRSAGHLLARGADPGRLLAEVMGKSTGYCGGKAGTLHISAKELGVVLTSTIVGGELSLAPGVALAQKQLGKQGIVTVFFGDGAATEGIFHEALNLAAVWELPVLFVCENNQWQAYVHRTETMKTDHISTWADRYGMQALTVDGNDVEAVHSAAKRAVEQIRATGKPVMLETYTYRMRGHMEADDQLSYVDAKELAWWGGKDPIAKYRGRALQQGWLSAEQIRAIETNVASRMEVATGFAVGSPVPEMSAVLTDVYA